MRLIDADALMRDIEHYHLSDGKFQHWVEVQPTIEPERLTDDDFETIRIHLNAYKEKLCNQQKWEAAEEYQRIIDRFTAFASAQPEIVPCKECKWYEGDIMGNPWGVCCHDGWKSGNIGHEVSENGWCYRKERRTDATD